VFAGLTPKDIIELNASLLRIASVSADGIEDGPYRRAHDFVGTQTDPRPAGITVPQLQAFSIPTSSSDDVLVAKRNLYD